MRRRRKRGKKTQKTLIKHAKLRAAQRYDITLSRRKHDEVVRQIQEGLATLVEKQSLRVTVWLVKIEEINVPVCYDKKRKCIITCLPFEYLDRPKP